MRSILHNLVLVPVIAAAAFTTTAAVAETNLQIPFSFKVADKSYPAGTYAVERTHTGNFVTVKSRKDLSSFTLAVGPGEPRPTDSRVAMSFDTLGQTHVLRSVQYHASITAQLDKHNKQQELAPAEMTLGQ